MDTAASQWLSTNLADVLVAVARANATLGAQAQPIASQEGSQDE